MQDTKQFRRALVEWDLERMNLPEEYWRATVEGVADSVRPAVVRYLIKIDEMKARGAGLLVTGPKGVGKTGVAALVAKEARCRGYTVFFTRVWELREMLRSRIWFDDESTISDRVRDVDILVLDDLREEDAREKFFTLSEIQELIRFRGSRHRITIVTTMMSVGGLTSKEVRPFVEAAQGVLVMLTMVGPNLYQQKQDELQRAILGD